MKQNKRTCPVCTKEIIGRHGNRRYHEECAWEVKLKQSKNQYAGKSLEADPCWKNEKILRDFFYYICGSQEIDPQLLDDAGLDFDLFNSTAVIDEQKVFVMKKFAFAFSNNKKVLIWKL